MAELAQSFSLNDRMAGLADYPFARLQHLLGSTPPPADHPTLNLAIGEPQAPLPDLARAAMAEAAKDWNRYPSVQGTESLRKAAADWLTRRYDLPAGFVDHNACLLPVTGTREALYHLAMTVVPASKARAQPLVMLPNPFYAVYEGAARMAGAVPIFLPATATTGFLPDLDAIADSDWARVSLFYLCSPSNPQGAAASLDYLIRLLGLARRFGFVLAVDECYAEIWDQSPPCGAMQAALTLGGAEPLSHLLIFHSLSKRSNAAGLRSGFMAGDPRLIAACTRLRSYHLAGSGLPIMAAAAALWRDEAHVAVNRAFYRANFDLAQQFLGDRLGFSRPQGGFFLWLDVGTIGLDGEQAALRLWTKAGVRVLPGAYLTRPEPDGTNIGAAYVRVALVHDAEITTQALLRLRACLIASPLDTPAARTL
jgi:N-succinyldiaminopimelate aminotransferase